MGQGYLASVGALSRHLSGIAVEGLSRHLSGICRGPVEACRPVALSRPVVPCRGHAVPLEPLRGRAGACVRACAGAHAGACAGACASSSLSCRVVRGCVRLSVIWGLRIPVFGITLQATSQGKSPQHEEFLP